MWNCPLLFFSTKLNATQSAWTTIEREAYDALIALQKYRKWMFGSKVTVHAGNNPLLLTESAPNSAKLMRWALGIQEFSVTFSNFQISSWTFHRRSRLLVSFEIVIRDLGFFISLISLKSTKYILMI